jgi:hypothetical protein
MRSRQALLAVAAGWVAILGLPYLGDFLLRGTRSPEWLPTFRLTLNCFELFGAGYLTGRLNPGRALPTVFTLAATLILVDIADADLLKIPIDVRWLIRLTWDVLTDWRYLDSWVSTAATHLLLCGCLLAGGFLSRQPEPPLSLHP